MVEIVSVNGFQGFSAVLETGDSLKALTGQVAATTGLTLHDGTTNYQVPTAKVLTLLGMYFTSGDTASTFTLYSSTAADGTTGEVDKFATGFAANINVNVLTYLPITGTLAADLFLTAKVANTQIAACKVTVIAVESDV